MKTRLQFGALVALSAFAVLLGFSEILSAGLQYLVRAYPDGSNPPQRQAIALVIVLVSIGLPLGAGYAFLKLLAHKYWLFGSPKLVGVGMLVGLIILLYVPLPIYTMFPGARPFMADAPIFWAMAMACFFLGGSLFPPKRAVQ